MSDTTTMYEECVHGLLVEHLVGCRGCDEWAANHEEAGRINTNRDEWVSHVCPGGRERTFEFLEECCTRCGNECDDHSVGVWKEIADERRVAQPPVNIGNL